MAYQLNLEPNDSNNNNKDKIAIIGVIVSIILILFAIVVLSINVVKGIAIEVKKTEQMKSVNVTDEIARSKQSELESQYDDHDSTYNYDENYTSDSSYDYSNMDDITYDASTVYKDKDTSNFAGSESEIENLVNETFPLASNTDSKVSIKSYPNGMYTNYSKDYIYEVLISSGNAYNMQGNPWIKEDDPHYDLHTSSGWYYSLAAVPMIPEAFDEDAVAYIFISNDTGKVDQIILSLNGDLSYNVTIDRY